MRLISKSMIYFLLRGERNLKLEKAKIVAKKTGTDPMVWIDPARVAERREAWERTFPKKSKRGKSCEKKN